MNGEKPLSVTAVTQQIKPDVYPRVDDEATIILTYPKAQAIIIRLPCGTGPSTDQGYGRCMERTGFAITVRRDDLESSPPR